MTNLVWLQDWYKSQCNEDWEHQYGVGLETLDNPGWGLRVDLKGTTHEGAVLRWRKIERSEEDWIHWCVHHARFVGYGGAGNLDELVGILRNFLESNELAGVKEDGPVSVRDGQSWRALAHNTRDAGIPSYEPDTHLSN